MVIVAMVTFGRAPIAKADRRHTMAAGETLEAVARAVGCRTATLMKFNRVDTTLLPPGTRVKIPDCVVKKNAVTEPVAPHSASASDGVPTKTVLDEGAASIGAPWHGHLRGGAQLPPGEGYVVRRPQRSWGAPHALRQIQQAIASVRAEFGDLHNLAIGDMSKAGGGRIDDHKSHQSGLDIDIGFYFQEVPGNYPADFARADEKLDLPATWALVTAFANLSERPDGVAVIFLDHRVAGRLYQFALDAGVDQETLALMFEYPHGRGAGVGIIRHAPNHANHIHVRFRCASDDRDCRGT
jgi:Penicillin-insensitive murein endopeptidase/LysM domain